MSSLRKRAAAMAAPTSMPIRFDARGQLDLSDWHTIRLEIVALRAFEELSRRDDHTPGFDLAKLLDADDPPTGGSMNEHNAYEAAESLAEIDVAEMARGEDPQPDPLAEYCPECRAVAGASCRAYGTGRERAAHDERIARAKAQAWLYGERQNNG